MESGERVGHSGEMSQVAKKEEALQDCYLPTLNRRGYKKLATFENLDIDEKQSCKRRIGGGYQEIQSGKR